MPTVSVSYRDLISLLGRDIPQTELVGRIPMMGGTVESVGGDAMVLEFFANRPDLYSVEGIARALRGFLGWETGLPNFHREESSIRCTVDPELGSIRPYIVAASVRGLRMTDGLVRSLVDLQEKLHNTVGRKRKKVSIGLHDLDPLSPPLHYRAVGPEEVTFIPLGETRAFSPGSILEELGKGREFAALLRGKPQYPLLVDARDQVLSFPPIINGVVTAVTERTQNLFIDVTGTDLLWCRKTLNILVTALSERGGRIQGVTMEYQDEKFQTPDLTPKQLTLDPRYAEKLIGQKIPIPEMVDSLEKMRHGAIVQEGEIAAEVAAYRVDVIHPIDLVEDVAIGYGYGRIPRSLPRIPTLGEVHPLIEAAGSLRDTLVGYGYVEVVTPTFINPSEADDTAVLIANPIELELSALRTSLLPSLLRVLHKNRHRDLPQRIFEVGEVVLQAENRQKVAGLSLSSKSGYTEMKSLVQALCRDSRFPFRIESIEHPSLIYRRCASVLSVDGTVGVFGEVRPEVLEQYSLGYPACGFELDVEGFLGHDAPPPSEGR